jgi:trans-aconitate 2-methyltransferase
MSECCDFDGELYRRASGHQKEWGSRIIDGLELKGCESVLDLGCGDGTLTKRLADRVPGGRVLGIDASEGMIRSAGTLEGGNLRFLVMDIRRLGAESSLHPEFEPGFDVIFSNATLHWIFDHRQLLSDCRTLLRPGGMIRFSFAGAGNCETFNRIVRETMDRPSFRKLFREFEWPWFMPELDAYRDLVRTSGFADAGVWMENADRYFEDADAMTRWIDQPSLVPFLSALPEAVRARFRDGVVRDMIAETRGEDGRCFETFRRIHVAINNTSNSIRNSVQPEPVEG